MKIRVDQLKDKPRNLSAVEEVSVYPTLAVVEESGECTFLGPLSVELVAAKEFDHIRVEGRVETRVRLACSRCLAEYEMDIASPFTIFYVSSTDVSKDEEVELAEQDLISVAFDGDEIDFTNEIAEQVLMEIPFKPLCSEDCKGLCAHCGVDLNEAGCNCEQLQTNIKFSVLNNFKAKK